MVAKKYWEKKIIDFVELVKLTKEEKQFEMLGFNFKLLPGVFSPIHSSDTTWFAKKIAPITMGKKFLEIGSGTGVIACLASIYQAAQVVATDINPEAVKNTILNAKLNAKNISTRLGNMFDPIAQDERFDIIFWNHPFHYIDEEIIDEKMLFSSVFDTKYRSLKEFFRKGKNHLTDNGKLVLGSSNIARINIIKKLAKDEGYTLENFEKTLVPVYKGEKTQMDIRIYTFSRANKALC